MHRRFAMVSCLAVLACTCDQGTVRSSLPGVTSPTPVGAPPPLPPRPPFVFYEPYTPIAIGETVTRVVSTDDPRCFDYPEWRCQYFRVTIPAQNDGTFSAGLTQNGGNIDISATDNRGGTLWEGPPAPGLGFPTVSFIATAGATYQINVWEYERPGIQYELRSSFVPR